ncbi:MAG: 2-C-methyl-D-erythritol 2,4-cyclodiphosphate synthase [Clostridia bacterium]|nr:2-C-methyl-D-erythritol 2,4-cyclodiphosphate synthase [Clostridia bacterium]
MLRIGIGEDTHRLTEGRPLILGGVEIPFRLGLFGHSDADALVHAVIDALLGAAALGDIGRHFPDSDPQYKGVSSILLLQKVSDLLEKCGYHAVNIDAVITAQEPKLAPYIDEMRKKLADAVSHIGADSVSVKATTPEHLGPEGNLECITVRAVALVAGD